ncbi:DUF1289 domain-containing protein [Undibacterium sp.]|uniref:DUF1289 domain-containing protein n=1 Tax=Undibacterium sp. TaxID=1914977 RepID=UPI0025DA8001|nr:DUF1289 domain-containing protein [Undibacterium sp.]MCX7217666.1 DUF1289 domain-containing protein [Burkholderiales bacterium]
MSILYEYDPDSPSAMNSSEVPSPCIGICKMDEERKWCSGCFRSIPELTAWSTASADSKRAVWREIKQRMFVSA